MRDLPMKAARLLSGLILAAAFSTPATLAQVRELPARPAPPATPRPELEGQALSYYLFCLAQEATLMRDYVAASDYLSRAVASDPDSASLRTELARTHIRLRETEKALQEARRAAELDETAAEPRRLILEITMDRAEREDPITEETFQAAVSAHLEVLKVDPADAGARISLGRLYFDRGLFMQAGALLRQHLESNPSDPDASMLLAQALIRTGDGEAALKVLEGAAGAAPDRPELQLALADALQAGGEGERALPILERLVEEHPRRVSYRFALARTYFRVERYAKAAEEAKRLLDGLAMAPAGSSEEAALRAAHMLLIDAEERGGRLDEALTGAIVAERRFPDDTRYPMRRAEILLVEGRLDEAEAIFEGMRSGDVNAGGRISMVYLRAGARMERDGSPGEAEALLRRAVDADSGNHSALNYLGYMLADRGEALEEAHSLIRRAVNLEPENGAYLDSMGWVLFRMGRHQEAEERLLRAAELIPEEPVVYDHLGDVYRSRGEPERALKAWREALRLGIEGQADVEGKIRAAGGGTEETP